jgi:hypothetical protein
VHGVLAAISIAFGLAIGRMGWRTLRSSVADSRSADSLVGRDDVRDRQEEPSSEPMR